MTSENKTTIVAYDPGKITGIAEGVFSDTEPLTILDALAVTYEELIEGFPFMLEVQHDIRVSEVFTSRTNNEFAADLIGVRVEGILDVAYGGDIVWRDRTLKSQVPDSILKEHGIWVTGSDVNWEDGRDANDAIIHMIGHVAFNLKHKPTLQKYFLPKYELVEIR
jgi:hypothetical protein